MTNYFKGNNPHNGNLTYDNGYEYFSYFNTLFKYASENYLFDEFYSEEDFISRCICYAENHNLFKNPLPEREILSIGKSVGKWVYRNMSPEGFFEWAEARRKKSLEVRQEQSVEKKRTAIALFELGYKKSEIASMLNLGHSQLTKYFNS